MTFFRYLEQEKRYDTEAVFIDKVLKKEHFIEKTCKNVHQKLVPDPFFISIDNPKQPLPARNSFKSKIF